MVKKLVKRIYKYKIFPSKHILKKLEKTLKVCRFLYNAELEYGKVLWFSKKRFVGRNNLNLLIPDWKAVNPNLKKVHSQVLQNVSDRLDKAFKSFFSRVKHGEKAGFPRFKSEEKYNSFIYPQKGFKLERNKLKLSKIGTVSIKLHRKLEGKVKTLAIKRTATNKWFACFSVEEEKEISPHKANKSVGIDVGIKSFYADRDVMSAMLIKASALEEYTAGTAGINACGDVPLGTSMKQEWTNKLKT